MANREKVQPVIFWRNLTIKNFKEKLHWNLQNGVENLKVIGPVQNYIVQMGLHSHRALLFVFQIPQIPLVMSVLHKALLASMYTFFPQQWFKWQNKDFSELFVQKYFGICPVACCLTNIFFLQYQLSSKRNISISY